MKFVLLCREFSDNPKLRDATISEVSLTVSALSSAGHDVVVLAGRTPLHPRIFEQIHPKVHVVRIPEQEITSPFRCVKLLEAISEQHCDVIVNYLSFLLFPKFGKLLTRLHITAFHRLIHGPLFFADVNHALADLLFRYPLTYGRFDLYDAARMLYPACLLRRAFRSSTFGTVITQSHRTQEWLLRVGLDDQRVMTVPPAIEPVWFREPDDMTSKPSYGLPKVLYYGGGPSILRGIDTLIHSLRYLRDSNTCLDVYLRGFDRHDEQLLLRLARELHLSSQVRIALGFQDPSFLVEKVLRSHCVVLPFKLMAKVADIPLAAIEPMACGKPVISTCVGAIPEVVEHGKNGLLVRPNAMELSRAIQTVLEDDSLRARLSSNARKTAETYKSDFIMQKLVHAYERQ